MQAAKRPYSHFQLSGAPSMPKITVSTIVKLIIACLLVGLVLSTLDVDPRNILASGQAAIEWLIEVGGEFFAWAVTYILIGAIVVIPIWVIMYLLRAAKSRD
jgi:hypothetical protein